MKKMHLNGSLIKKLRLQNDLSQSELADRIGTNKSTLSKIENGQIKDITLSTGMRLAKYFNMKIENLYLYKK